ncbi:MAG: amidohydrolase family protein [Phycisphaerales bacterium]|nr:amidohydrolase family protein [Phycisphaerales bacterium]
MRSGLIKTNLIGIAFGFATAIVAPALADQAPVGHAFVVAKVVSMDDSDTVVNDAVVLVRDGKIETVGEADQVTIPAGYAVHHFEDRWLAPGLVEGHNHTSGGLGDLNDMVYLTNPGLDTRSAIDPDNDLIKRARMGGVTTVMLIPGSGTNMSGLGTLTKTAGKDPCDVIIRSPGSLKIAQAGNPEWYFGGVGRSFMNWNTRQTLLKARDYHLAWERFEKGETTVKPEFDPTFEPFRGLFRKEYPATVHTQIYQVLMTTVDMVANKLDIWTVLDHCTFDAWKVAPLVNKSSCWTINGPRQYQFDRTARRMIGNASGWWKNGVHKLGINTDAPVVPEAELSYQAAMACWYGWEPYPALRGVTAVPAKALGVYDRVGSIQVGKDADFGIWTGNPLDPRSACLMLMVNGKIAYDGTTGVRRF